MVSGIFNPSIWTTGTFTEATHTLVTGSYGFGGWSYSNGVNLSGYKYLVAKLGNTNASSVSFRLFDENSYWTTPAQYDFGTSRRVVVTLANMKKGTTAINLNPNHIFIVGFWSTGGKSIIVEDVYLTNNDNYLPMALEEISARDIDESEPVDIYIYIYHYGNQNKISDKKK